MMEDTTNIFEESHEFVDTTGFQYPASPDDLFSIFQSLEAELAQLDGDYHHAGASQQSSSRAGEKQIGADQPVEAAAVGISISPVGSKRPRAVEFTEGGTGKEDGLQKMSHITVERNRRKQMNEHLSVLRSLMPCFYVKRGDQASIIGGVVDYISELQQILQSLEAKKQRKVYSETVLSPRPVLSPRTLLLSPRPKLPPSPRLNHLPISPRTPTPITSPYRPMSVQQSGCTHYSGAIPCTSPTSSSNSSINESLNELSANSKSSIADVEVKFSGANLILKTVSPRIPGQVTKIISVLEELSLEILQVNINSVDQTTVNSFTIKVFRLD
ncbi:hypothetical protein SAY87_011801 [Trapa incisa]|uniref:BHLH domain-containing protein n=1 Tax=Trapa incisa TaxID=236973 RepID=A0AAN7GPB5_9MYRT|nr:hypothetical protein SAY87_011801 [Trapa incisa]